MKISRQSWHYRLSKGNYFLYGEPANLCHYFWRVVWHLVRWPLVAAVVIGLLVGTLLFCRSYPEKACQIALAAASIAGIIVGLFLLSLIIVTAVFVAAGMKWLRGTLLFQYLKACKQRICPLIEYED
jgi:hypothetical protein